MSLYVYVLSPCKSLHASLRVRKQEVAPGLHNIHFHRVFRVAPIGWKEHCFWRWALVHILCCQLQPPFSEVSYPILSSGWCVCVCLLCLVHLWVNECVGGSRISFEAPGISFYSPFVCRPESGKIEHQSHLAVCSAEQESKRDKCRTKKGIVQKRNHQRGRAATQKVRSKTKFWELKKKRPNPRRHNCSVCIGETSRIFI